MFSFPVNTVGYIHDRLANLDGISVLELFKRKVISLLLGYVGIECRAIPYISWFEWYSQIAPYSNIMKTQDNK